MAPLPYIQHTERLVGQGHPTLPDELNAALRALLSGSGYDPDADPPPIISDGPAVINALNFAGATAGQKIQAAVTSLAGTGGIVDCRGFSLSSFMLLDVDICAGLALYNRVPITFLWGPNEVRIKTRSIPRSHHHHVFHGTQFILRDEVGGRVTGSVFPFYVNSFDTTPAAGITTTSGSAVITLTNPADPLWGKLEVGSPLIINGFVPPIGKDQCLINGAIGSGDTTITVDTPGTGSFHTSSDAGWPAGGRLRIENEIVAYTSKNATQFLGCTRGAEGTTAAAHGDNVVVNRVSHQPFYVLSISGSSVTLDAPMNITATGLQAQIGHLDVTFEGSAVFDGNKDVTDDPNNPMGLWLIGLRNGYIGSDIRFKNWDHGGWSLTECQDFTAFGTANDCGGAFGLAFWVFGWNKRISADIMHVEGCHTALAVDDRSTTPQIVDGPAEDSSFYVRHATRMGISSLGSGNGFIAHGSRRCSYKIDRASFIAGLSGCQAVAGGGAGQWGDETTNPMRDNDFDIGFGDDPSGTYLAMNMTSAGNAPNTIRIRQRNPVANTQPQNMLVTPDGLIGLTYGATIDTRAERTETWLVHITDTNAHTIANPTQLTEGRKVSYRISAGVGGVAVTGFGGMFRLAGAFVAPANGQAREITFRYHRSSNTLNEISRTPADQPI